MAGGRIGLSEDAFWSLIATLGGSTSRAAYRSLVAVLAERPPPQILGFEDQLASALHAIDTAVHFEQEVMDVEDGVPYGPIPLSDDSFLYARCAVVSAGRAVHRRVLADPAGFAGTWDLGAEELLNVAHDAWTRSTGEAWDDDRDTPVSYETGSNEDGWPGRGTDACDDTEVITRDGVPIGGWWLVVADDAGTSAAIVADLDDLDLGFEAQAARLGIPRDAEMIGNTDRLTSVSAPMANTRTTEILRRHGGLDGEPISVDLQLAHEWRFGVSQSWDGRGEVRERSGPGWQIKSADEWRWTDDETDRAVIAMTAHSTLHVLRERGLPHHPAVAELRALVAAGADLVPPLRSPR